MNANAQCSVTLFSKTGRDQYPVVSLITYKYCLKKDGFRLKTKENKCYLAECQNLVQCLLVINFYLKKERKISLLEVFSMQKHNKRPSYPNFSAKKSFCICASV